MDTHLPSSVQDEYWEKERTGREALILIWEASSCMTVRVLRCELVVTSFSAIFWRGNAGWSVIVARCWALEVFSLTVLPQVAQHCPTLAVPWRCDGSAHNALLHQGVARVSVFTTGFLFRHCRH